MNVAAVVWKEDLSALTEVDRKFNGVYPRGEKMFWKAKLMVGE